MPLIAGCLDSKRLGESLRLIPALDRQVLWYFGAFGAHLSLRQDSHEGFDQMVLCFADSLVQWDSQGGLQSGRLIQAWSPGELLGIFRVDTLFFEPDSDMNEKRLIKAREILMHSHLHEKAKDWGIRLLTRE